MFRALDSASFQYLAHVSELFWWGMKMKWVWNQFRLGLTEVLKWDTWSSRLSTNTSHDHCSGCPLTSFQLRERLFIYVLLQIAWFTFDSFFFNHIIDMFVFSWARYKIWLLFTVKKSIKTFISPFTCLRNAHALGD